ncbi:ABC transporter permease [Lysinibacillus sp. 3P01SB]|uniref:ABC transporter permease n=1 Tax=Lysinibacillus sp. 3P01SB TaxID=3132284 RepID=UPI0039A70A5E
MLNYFKFEFLHFFYNKKNIAVYVILLFFSFYYAMTAAPSYDPIEKVDAQEMEARYLTKEEFLNSVDMTREMHPLTAYAVQTYPEWNRFEKERLDALAKNDLKAYAEATSGWYTYSDWMIYAGGDMLFYHPRYYTYGNHYAREDGHFAYLSAASRYGGYAEGDYALSIDVFEERTALQTWQRLLQSYLPFILIVSCILLTADIVLKDRRNPTLLRGFPMSPWRKLLAKGGVALFGSILAFLPLSAGLLIIGMKHGFGSFDLPVPIYSHDDKTFSLISLGEFIFQNTAFIILWFMLIISLLLLTSILLRNEFANLFIGCAVVFGEFMYYTRGIGFIREVEWYPTSFIQVGQVLSGYRNYVYESHMLTFKNGMLVIGLCICLALLITFIISNHRKFKQL